MALDFGIIGNQDKTLQTADYRTAGSHQAENLKFLKISEAANTWQEVYTVSADKTYYVSAIVLDSGNDTSIELGTGAAASEVVFFYTVCGISGTRFNLAFPTPIKFQTGTRISARTSAGANTGRVTLVGWEE